MSPKPPQQQRWRPEAGRCPQASPRPEPRGATRPRVPESQGRATSTRVRVYPTARAQARGKDTAAEGHPDTAVISPPRDLDPADALARPRVP